MSTILYYCSSTTLPAPDSAATASEIVHSDYRYYAITTSTKVQHVLVLHVLVLTCGVQPVLLLFVRDQTLLLADVLFEGGSGVQHTLLITL